MDQIQDDNLITEASSDTADTSQTIDNAPIEDKAKKSAKKKLSGDYYYVETDQAELAKSSFTRTLLTVIAFLLQIVVLLLPQGCLEYVTDNIPSYAYAYMWAVFIMIAVSIYVLIMYYTRYKLIKRIPKERAPRRGFKNRTFFGTELFMAVNALMLVIEISFICIHYDNVGLVAVFLCAAALAASVFARQIALFALRSAVLITAQEQSE